MAEAEAAGHGHGDHDHPSYLQHHFDSPLQQFDSSKLGTWLFLATEILLFGGLFCAYAIYRANHPEIFMYAHKYLDTNMGAINTVILLCSSFTMAWGVRAAQLNQRRLMCILLALTLAGGGGFMVIKYFEYKAKWEHGLLWAAKYDPHEEEHAEESHGAESGAETHGADGADGGAAAAAAAGAAESHGEAPAAGAASEGFKLEQTTIALPAAEPGGTLLPELEAQAGAAEQQAETHGPAAESPKNVQTFFSIYFLMTGLHGLHVVLGMLAILYILIKGARGAYSSKYFTPVDIVGLYWHLVDLIWIFLFPLLYLIH